MSLSPISAVPPPAPSLAPPVGPGRSALSVGHLAKAAVAEARAAGIDLPRNAQGMAASRIARGPTRPRSSPHW